MELIVQEVVVISIVVLAVIIIVLGVKQVPHGYRIHGREI